MLTLKVTLDTHRAVKILKNAGLDLQAEAVVETTNKTGTVGDLKENMATKEDLNALMATMATKEDLNDLKATMATKEQVKTEIAKVLKHIYVTWLTRIAAALVTLSKLL